MKMKLHEREILVEDFGRIADNKIEINMSSTYTRLIQEAGRWCEYYASDIIICINDISKRIDENKLPEDMILGFRESGVDFDGMVENNLSISYYYRKVLKIVFDKSETELIVKLIEMC